MTAPPDIVCVSLTTWAGDYTTSTGQLMAELARRHRVLFVSYAPTLKDVYRHWRGKKRRLDGSGWRETLRTVTLPHGGVLHVLTPPCVLPVNPLPPGPVYDALLAFNLARIRRSIRRACRRLGFEKPVVVNALHPTVGLGLLGQLGERATVYYCYDEISAETWSKAHGVPREREFLRQADAVVVSSAGLLERKKPLNPRCFLVENGVDFDLFHRAYPHSPQARPTVGYLGAIDNRLDAALLEACFGFFPNVRFLFVGRVPEAELRERFGWYGNVEFTGPKTPGELPDLVRQMDVGLIPFVKNEQTRAIYPLKINEYLAAGLPVVTTHFADLRAFEGVARVVDSTEEFLRAVQESLAENDPEAERQRIAVARGNSWERRGEVLEGVLNEILNVQFSMFNEIELSTKSLNIEN